MAVIAVLMAVMVVLMVVMDVLMAVMDVLMTVMDALTTVTGVLMTYFWTNFRNLLPGRSQKVKKQCTRFGPVDHFNRVKKTQIAGMAH
jgi:hypothetical protein